MKTITEFNAFSLKNFANTRAELTASGKTPEELPAALGEALKLEGEKLNFVLQALETIGTKVNDLKRVVVYALTEGEKEPSKAVKKGDHYYLVEHYPPVGGKAQPQGRDSGRGDKRDRGDRKKGKRGRGGEGRGSENRSAGDRPPRGEARPPRDPSAPPLGRVIIAAPGAGASPTPTSPNPSSDPTKRRRRRRGPRGPSVAQEPAAPPVRPTVSADGFKIKPLDQPIPVKPQVDQAAASPAPSSDSTPATT